METLRKVQVQLPAKMVDELRQAAKRHNVTLTEVLFWACNVWLEGEPLRRMFDRDPLA